MASSIWVCGYIRESPTLFPPLMLSLCVCMSRSPESVGQAAPVFTTAIQSGHRPPVLQTKPVPRPWVDLPILWRSNQLQVLETNLHVLIMASPLNSTSTSTACLWAHGICQGKIPRSWLNSEASKVKVVPFTKKKP